MSSSAEAASSTAAAAAGSESDASVAQYLTDHPEWLETFLLQNAQSDWLKDLSNRVRGIKREAAAAKKKNGDRGGAKSSSSSTVRLNLNLEGLEPLDLEPLDGDEEDDESTICST